jgi:hypothetical protein
VSEHGLHLIDEELRDDWLEAWIAEGLSEVEAYLRRHAAFDAFLDGSD